MRSSRMEETSVGAGLSAILNEEVEKNAAARMGFERVYESIDIF